MVLCVSYKTTAAQAPVASIGDISELTGTAEVIRDEPYGAVLDFDIRQMDDVRTPAGRVAITFLDDSIVNVCCGFFSAALHLKFCSKLQTRTSGGALKRPG